jgi:hypothetical protein
MQVAYIAHPISGNLAANIHAVKLIMAEIVRAEPDVLPFAPYLTALEILDDGDPAQRKIDMKCNRHLLQAGFVDEIRLYGPSVSRGMWEEIGWAFGVCIPIFARSEGTAAALRAAGYHQPCDQCGEWGQGYEDGLCSTACLYSRLNRPRFCRTCLSYHSGQTILAPIVVSFAK